MRVESSPNTQQFSRSRDGAGVLTTANQEVTERKKLSVLTDTTWRLYYNMETIIRDIGEDCG